MTQLKPVTTEIPYQLSVNQLKDALDHVMRLAKASRSQTKRLKVIAARAEMALNGEVYDGKDLKLPKEARSPMSYENELRVTKRDLAAALERERALTAHAGLLTELALSMDECEQDSHEMTKAWDAFIDAAYSSPATNLARRDLLKKAEALEEFADSLPKFQSMGAGTAMKLKARELRRQAEGMQREEDKVA